LDELEPSRVFGRGGRKETFLSFMTFLLFCIRRSRRRWGGWVGGSRTRHPVLPQSATGWLTFRNYFANCVGREGMG